MENPFKVDYTNEGEVIDFAQQMAKRYPRFKQYVIKYPERGNYNITMQVEKAVTEGAVIVWSS